MHWTRDCVFVSIEHHWPAPVMRNVRPDNTMKLIEHLEYVIGLLDHSAPQSEIKGALLAMHQEIESYEKRDADASDKIIKLVEEKKKIESEKAALKTQIDQFVAITKAKKPSFGGPPLTSIT